MRAICIQESASHRLDDIYRYTRDRWSGSQAEKYITDLFAAFDRIATHGVVSKPIPAEFGVEGFFFRHERHFVYWPTSRMGTSGLSLFCMSACIRSIVSWMILGFVHSADS